MEGVLDCESDFVHARSGVAVLAWRMGHLCSDAREPFGWRRNIRGWSFVAHGRRESVPRQAKRLAEAGGPP